LDNARIERKIYNTFFLNKIMQDLEKSLRWYMAVFVVYELLAFIAGVAAVPFQLQQFANNMLVGNYLVAVTLLLTMVLGFEATRETKQRLPALVNSLKFGVFAGLVNALVILAVAAFLPIQTSLASLITQEVIALVTFSLIGSLVGSFLALALAAREETRARRR
jgi:hypothetical protein